VSVSRLLTVYITVSTVEDVKETMTDTATHARFELRTRQLGALPIVDWFCDRLGLGELLEAVVPHDDARLRLAPAAAIGVLVRNLVLAREPVYALGRWAEPFDPGPLGLAEGEAELLNDDRVGRMLARLFDADRATLLTRLVLDAVARFGIDCSQLHNDSTSVTVTGRYSGADGRARGGKATAAITFGHNKDHRPDLKQLVWILTVSSDGAVPIAHRVVDGNTSDDVTHVDTWDQLVGLLGRTDFLYVADCKLATRDNMGHIHRHRGRFVSVLPASRKEDKTFRDWVVDHEPDWVEAARRPGARIGDPDEVWHTCEAPWPSAEGHRVAWVRSSAKTGYDAQARTDRIARGIAALDELNQRLASPKTRMKTVAAAEQAAAAALERIGAARWIDVHRRRTCRGTVPARQTRSPRHRDPLPQDHPHPPAHPLQRRRGPGRPRRRLRRLLPADQQRPRPDRRRAVSRLQIPAQPGETPRPAEGQPARRAGVPARPRPHRSPAVLPLHRHARPCAHRTPDPAGDENQTNQTTLALPRRPGLPRTHRRPHPGHLRRPGPPPPHRPPRPPGTDLPAPAHRATAARARLARHPAQRLHRMIRPSGPGDVKTSSRSAESQS
jgi:Domain of unknown function (DUF4277)